MFYALQITTRKNLENRLLVRSDATTYITKINNGQVQLYPRHGRPRDYVIRLAVVKSRLYDFVHWFYLF